MDEHAARDAVLVRAIETADGTREIWSDADRVAAGRAAAELVGDSAADDAFVGQRAALVLERLAKRHPQVLSLTRPPHARGWIGPLAAIAAFVIGAAGVDIGPAHRIDLLAPPVLALLAWNVVVYALLLWSAFAPHRGERPGPLRRSVVTWLRNVTRPVRKPVLPRPLVTALARFAADWSALAAPLWRQRATRMLHCCAAMLAAGAIAGLYVRGIALEYRAAWQSTFLDADDVARLLHAVLAPGSWLTGIAIPDAEHLRGIAAGSAGENAAPWIHLHAATLVLIVIAPRAALAAIAWWRERRLARRFPLALETAYFQRLLHAWREGAARVIAIPYSFDVPKANAEGLARLLMRVFQSPVDLVWSPPVPYGADETPRLPPATLAGVVGVFSLSATPEPEIHGAFVAALAADLADRAPLAALVDTSDFVARFRDQPRRIEERQAAWREMLAAQGSEPLFVRLAEPELAAAAEALGSRLDPVTP